MPKDNVSNWVQKAKNAGANVSGDNGVQVIRREAPASKGNMIMDIAERIRPYLLELFTGIRDKQGMLYQPAHVRGIALNMAQDLLKAHEDNQGTK